MPTAVACMNRRRERLREAMRHLLERNHYDYEQREGL
jgi:hypothetical protein